MRFLEQSRPAVFLVAAASAVFVIQALAWPLTEGRAGEFELLYFLDFWNRDPVFPGLMTKTPVPGLFFGFLLERGGAFGTELAVGACFVAAVYFVYRSGAIWSVPIGIAAAGATLLHVSYGGLFHKLDSDGLFAVAFAAWLYYSLKHADEHSVAVYFVHGLFVALLVMIRPANEVLVLFAVYPLLAGRQRLRRRLRYAAAFVAPVALLVGGWLTLNGVRYGEFSFSRFSNAAPLYHIMMSGHQIRPEDGPASATLAAAVEQELLTDEPYRSRGVDVRRFFAESSFRGWEDLISLSDLKFGWNSRYRILRDVAFEFIRRNPGEWLLGVNTTLMHTLIMRSQSPVQGPGDEARAVAGEPAREGAAIPHARRIWLATTADGRYENGRNQDRIAGLLARHDALAKKTLGLRSGVPAVAEALNVIANVFAPMILVVALGAIGLPFLGVGGPTIGPERVVALFFGMSLVLLVLTCALQPATIEYRLPLDPLFFLAALVSGTAVVRGRRVLATTASSVHRLIHRR